MDLWDSMHITGGEGKYSAKLCFCFHCTFIDQLFSRALWLWPTVLRGGPSLLSLRRVCDSFLLLLLCCISCSSQHAFIQCISWNTLNPLSETLLGSSATVATGSYITVTAFHLVKWVVSGEAVYAGNSVLSLALVLVWRERWKEAFAFRELGGPPTEHGFITQAFSWVLDLLIKDIISQQNQPRSQHDWECLINTKEKHCSCAESLKAATSITASEKSIDSPRK